MRGERLRGGAVDAHACARAMRRVGFGPRTATTDFSRMRKKRRRERRADRSQRTAPACRRRSGRSRASPAAASSERTSARDRRRRRGRAARRAPARGTRTPPRCATSSASCSPMRPRGWRCASTSWRASARCGCWRARGAPTTLRTSARMRCSCAPWLILSSAVGLELGQQQVGVRLDRRVARSRRRAM